MIIIICPKCRGKTFVTRSIEKNDFVVRYRKCNECGRTFKTREMTSGDWMYKEILRRIKTELDGVDL